MHFAATPPIRKLIFMSFVPRLTPPLLPMLLQSRLWTLTVQRRYLRQICWQILLMTTSSPGSSTSTLPMPASTACGGESHPAGCNTWDHLQQTISRMRLANPRASAIGSVMGRSLSVEICQFLLAIFLMRRQRLAIPTTWRVRSIDRLQSEMGIDDWARRVWQRLRRVLVSYPNRRAGHYPPTSHCKRDPESPQVLRRIF